MVVLRSGGGTLRVRVGLVILSAVLFSLIFFLSYPKVGLSIAALSFLPVALAGWFFGVRGGILAAFLDYGLLVLFLQWIGARPFEGETVFHGGMFVGGLVLVMLGAGVGVLHRFQERVQQELQERKQAETALLEREKRFRALIEHSSDSSALIDRAGIMLEGSPAAQHLFGINPHELVGQNVFDLIIPEEVLHVMHQFSKLVENPGSSVVIQTRYTGEDGTLRWVEVTGTNLLDEPSVGAIVINYHDITEQVSAKEALQTRMAHSQTLLVLAKQLELAQTYRVVLETARKEIRTTTGFQTLWIYLDHGNDEFLLLTSVGEASAMISQELPKLTIKGDPFLEELWQKREVSIIVDAQTDPRTDKTIVDRLGNRTIINIPLLLHDRLLGFLGTGTFGDEGIKSPSAEELEFLTAVASHVAVTISRIQLQEALEQRMRFILLLNRITQTALETTDLASIVQNLVDQLADLFEADACYLTLWDETWQKSIPTAASGPLEKTYPQTVLPPGEKTLTEYVLDIGHAIQIGNKETPQGLHDEIKVQLPEKSFLVLPLIAGEQKLGSVILAYLKTYAFALSESLRGEQAAAQIALIIAKTQLLEAERNRRVEAETLREVASTLVTSLDLDQVLENLLTSLQRVVPYDSACVFLREGDYVRAVAETGLPMPEQVLNKRFSLADNLLQPEIYRTGQPLVLEDVQKSPRFLKWGGTDYVRGWMGVPLSARGQVIGALTIDSKQPGAYTLTEARLAQVFANQAAIAIENARLFAETRQRQSELSTLLRISKTVSSSLDMKNVLEQVAFSMAHLLHLEWSVLSIYDPNTRSLRTAVEYSIDGGFTMEEIGKQYNLDDYPATAQILYQNEPLLIHINDPEAEPAEKALLREIEVACALLLPIVIAGRTVGLAELYTPNEHREFSQDEIRLAQALADQAAIAIANAQLFSETRQRLSEIEAVNRISKGLRLAHGMEDMLPTLLKETSVILGIEAGVIWLLDPLDQQLHQKAASGWFLDIQESAMRPGEGIAGKVYQTGESYISQEFSSDPYTREATRAQVPSQWGGTCVPLRAGHEVIGAFFISVQFPRQLTDQENRFLSTIAEIAGSAIHRAQLNTMIQNQLQRLLALRAIDSAISASLDLHLTLNLLLEHVLSELHVDAACVLLAAPYTYTLQFAAGRGFYSTAFQQVLLYFGEGLAGRVAVQQSAITISDLSQLDIYLQSNMAQQERFVFYTGVPLIAKGQVKGVLEVYHRSSFFAPPDWLDFLDALAAQAAIAIDSAQLFTDLQRSNSEITLAYDNTLEGWVKMLDLRDHETEGHTQRVTEMTLDLAQEMGLPDEDLIHIRRGALLHDIGKMAVPDPILLKPGPLTEEEWVIMRQHPQRAFDMLASIPFLRLALDIPYCHHEKWDGTGYPRGLRGEQIPLSARIFSIIDCWDALTNDRPYRVAWSKEKALAYLLEQSGKHFDPEILEIFLQMQNALTTHPEIPRL